MSSSHSAPTRPGRRLSFILIAFVLTSLVAACAAPAAPVAQPAAPVAQPAAQTEPAAAAPSGKITIGYSMPTLHSEFFVAMDKNIKAYPTDKQGIEVTEVVADNDVNKQLSQIEDMISKKVSAIVVTPVDSKAIMASVQAANAAGIPILFAARPPAEMNGVAYFIGSDEPVFGKTAAEELAKVGKAAGQSLKVLVLMGDLRDENAVKRDTSFREAAKAAGMEVVAEVPTEWNPEKALDGVTNALQAHPEINAVFAPSDSLLPSVISSLKANQRLFKVGEKDHVFIVSIDGDPYGAKMLQDGYSDIDLAQDVNAHTGKALDNAVTLAQGGKLDATEEVIGPIIGTPTNIKELGAKFWGTQFAN